MVSLYHSSLCLRLNFEGFLFFSFFFFLFSFFLGGGGFQLSFMLEFCNIFEIQGYESIVLFLIFFLVSLVPQ